MAAKMAATKMSPVTELFIGGGCGGRGMGICGVLRKRYSLAGGGGCVYDGVLRNGG